MQVQSPYPIYPSLAEEYIRRQQKAYTRRIFGLGNRIGAGLLFLDVIGTIVLLGLQLVMDRLLPGATDTGIYYESVEYVLYASASMILAFCIAAWMGRQSVVRLLPFEKHSFKLGLSCVLFAFLGIWVGNFVTGVITSLLPQVQESYELILNSAPATYLELALDLLQTAAIPALVEEFAFRGVMLGMLRPYGDKFAIIITSVLFALVHGNFVQIPFAFCTGIMLAYCVVRTNNLWPAILVHFINNAYSVLVSYFAESLGIFNFVLAYMWFVLGIVGMVLLILSKQGVFRGLKPYAGCVSPSKRTWALLRSPVLIIACLIYLANAVQLIFLTMVPQ